MKSIDEDTEKILETNIYYTYIRTYNIYTMNILEILNSFLIKSEFKSYILENKI